MHDESIHTLSSSEDGTEQFPAPSLASCHIFVLKYSVFFPLVSWMQQPSYLTIKQSHDSFMFHTQKSFHQKSWEKVLYTTFTMNNCTACTVIQFNIRTFNVQQQKLWKSFEHLWSYRTTAWWYGSQTGSGIAIAVQTRDRTLQGNPSLNSSQSDPSKIPSVLLFPLIATSLSPKCAECFKLSKSWVVCTYQSFLFYRQMVNFPLDSQREDRGERCKLRSARLQWKLVRRADHTLHCWDPVLRMWPNSQ